MQPDATQGQIIEIEDDSENDDFQLDEFFEIGAFEDPFNRDDLLESTLPRVPSPTTSHRACVDRVLEVFPDISRDHLQQLYDARITTPTTTRDDDVFGDLVRQIADAEKYPKEKDRLRELKRKISEVLNSDQEDAATWAAQGRGTATWDYSQAASVLLQEEFVDVPKRFIDLKLKELGRLYPAYLVLEAAEREYDDITDPPYRRLKISRRKLLKMETTHAMEPHGYGVEELKREIHAARKKRRKDEAKRQLEKDAAAAEAATEKEYRDNGDTMDCQCCFETYPINKLTHCDGDEPHFFCFDCAVKNAETDIGNSRYHLLCMDGSGCQASFSREQKHRFLKPKTLLALGRIQQQAEIRQADLENLSNCPFCDFAAICPPVEVDREFRCGNPECEKTSCRLCQLESHLPLSCEESRKENGISERHVVEEARTMALIRTCPRCKVSVIKDEGCNKVVCKCGGMMCDYCGKDITKNGYGHFEGGAGPSLGSGRKCPTYDDTHSRKEGEINKAEQEALKRIRNENPNLAEEDLKINFSDVTKSPPRTNPHLVHHRHMHYQMHQHLHGRRADPPADFANHIGAEMMRRHQQLDNQREELLADRQGRMEALQRQLEIKRDEALARAEATATRIMEEHRQQFLANLEQFRQYGLARRPPVVPWDPQWEEEARARMVPQYPPAPNPYGQPQPQPQGHYVHDHRAAYPQVPLRDPFNPRRFDPPDTW